MNAQCKAHGNIPLQEQLHSGRQKESVPLPHHLDRSQYSVEGIHCCGPCTSLMLLWTQCKYYR